MKKRKRPKETSGDRVGIQKNNPKPGKKQLKQACPAKETHGRRKKRKDAQMV